jgi:CelD/BcsL family acetyltransferase involved in cellulose biosynthesis
MREFECECVQSGDRLAPFELEWAALQARAPAARLSDSVEWARCCWGEGLPGKPLHLVVRRQGQAIAILPLLVRREGLFNVARPLACPTTEYCPLLMAAAAEPAGVVTAMTRAISGLSAIDAVVLPNVRDDLARAALLKSGLQVREIDRRPVQFLQTSAFADWEAYRDQLSRRVRTNLKRSRRRLSQLGELRFEELADPDARRAAWAWMVSRKRDWLVRKGLDSAFIPSDAFARFTQATLEISSPVGRRSIFALKLNGQLVAADLVNIDRARVEMFVCTYDPAFADCAPGNVLRDAEVGWAFANGLDFEWRLGDEAYKADWASHTTTANTYVLARNRRGQLFGAYLELRTLLAYSTPTRLRARIRNILRRLRGGG